QHTAMQAGAAPAGLAAHLTGFTGLLAHNLILVANTLALVRFGRAQLADISSHHADQFLVRRGDDHFRTTVFDREGHRRRRDDQDVMGIPQAQPQIVALHLRPVARADDTQPLLITLAHARHPIGDQGAGQAVQRPVLTAVGRARDDDVPVLNRDLHIRVKAPGEFAFRAFYLYLAPIHLDGHAIRDGNRLLANSRHHSLHQTPD